MNPLLEMYMSDFEIDIPDNITSEEELINWVMSNMTIDGDRCYPRLDANPQIVEWFNKIVAAEIGEALSKLVDQGLVQMVMDEDGIGYVITELGKALVCE